MKAKRFLCPVDFSPCSNVAFRHAIDLAVAEDASLILLHVSPPPPTFAPGMVGYGPMPGSYPEPDARLEEMQDSRVEIEYVHLIGVAGDVIVQFADEKDVEMIIMGTHGYGELSRILFGSVAEHVLRHAKSTVIVVKDRKGESAENTDESS